MSLHDRPWIIAASALAAVVVASFAIAGINNSARAGWTALLEMGIGGVIVAALLEAWHARQESQAWALVSDSVRSITEANMQTAYGALAFPFISEYERLSSAGISLPDDIYDSYSGSGDFANGLTALASIFDTSRIESDRLPGEVLPLLMRQGRYLRKALEELSRDILPRLMQLRADPTVVSAALSYERELKNSVLLYTPEGTEGLPDDGIMEQACEGALQLVGAMSHLENLLRPASRRRSSQASA